MGPEQVALARHYSLTVSTRLPFARIRDELAGLLLERPHQEGMIVTNHATLNAACAAGETAAVTGRLYGFLVADTDDRLRALDAAVTTRLHGVEGGDR